MTDSTAQLEWSAWRTERDAGLAEDHGWLTLTALHFLTEEPTAYPGLPGLWWADEQGVSVRAVSADGVLAADTSQDRPVDTEVLDGVHVVDVSATGSTIAAHVPGNVAVEAGVRSGRHILRVRDPRSATFTGFTGVPTFDYDPGWVMDVPVRWYPEPEPAVVGAAQPGLSHPVTVNGEVDCTRDGRTVTLRLIGSGPGEGTLMFTDTSTDTAAWRSLSVGAGAEPDTVRLDFNRALNMPCAFTDYGTCPQPVTGNDLPFDITAGERRPR